MKVFTNSAWEKLKGVIGNLSNKISDVERKQDSATSKIDMGIYPQGTTAYTGNLDDLRTPGIYVVSSAAANKPASEWGCLLVISPSKTAQANVTQMFICISGLFSRWRQGSPESWSLWK